MAKKEQILGGLSGQSGPVTLGELAKVLDIPSGDFKTQLDRLVKDNYVEITTDKKYVLTDAGNKAALEGNAVKPPHRDGEEPVELATTEYQQFIRLGKSTGVVPSELIQQTADHVWNGGDWQDLTWIWRAMKEMDIRNDLARRWWHSWRSRLRKDIPDNVAQEVRPTRKSKDGDDAGKEGETGIRSHIIDADDKPVYVGEGMGDLNYKDAVRIAEVRAAAKARGNNQPQPATAGSMADELVKVMSAIDQLRGGQEKKSYIVKQGQDGAFQAEEVEEGKPLVVSPPSGPAPAPSYLVNADGTVTELKPGAPVVIKQAAPAPPAVTSAPAKQYVIDRNTGEVSEITDNKPIVIIREGGQSMSPMLKAVDAQGNPLVIDLDSYFRLEEHKAKMDREKEAHEVKMDLSKTFKELLGKASKAVQNMEE